MSNSSTQSNNLPVYGTTGAVNVEPGWSNAIIEDHLIIELYDDLIDARTIIR